MKVDSRRVFLIGPMVAQGPRAKARVRLAAAFRGLRPIPGYGSGDLIIAVDGGLDFCDHAGLPVSLALGDWDSLKKRTLLKSVHHITLPRDKDRSDLCFALEAAIGTGVRRIYLGGFSGGRLDHELANCLDMLSVASSASSMHSEIVMCSESYECAVVTSRRRFAFRQGQVVSIFALAGPAEGVRLKGFRYPLRSGVMEPSSQGLSNVVETRSCEVSVQKGGLLVIAYRVPTRKSAL